MSYRQKINGPMCFVEFEEVLYASQAIKELYGHNLVSFITSISISLPSVCSYGVIERRVDLSKEVFDFRTPRTLSANEVTTTPLK